MLRFSKKGYSDVFYKLMNRQTCLVPSLNDTLACRYIQMRPHPGQSIASAML